MSACRESRKSERHFERVIQAVRNMDKLLWLGSDHHLEDLREYARQITQDVDFVVEERAREIEAEINRRKRTEMKDPTGPTPGIGTRLANF